MLKQNLRLELLRKRLGLDDTYIQNTSKKVIVNLFSNISFKNQSKILVYLPIKNEVDTSLLIEKLTSEGKELFLPALSMKHWIVSKFDPNGEVEKVFGEVYQPQTIVSVDGRNIDIAIVPGIAFSTSGARLGFGFGVYDKLLARTSAIKIGLCYDFQLVDDVDISPMDVKMDFVVSEVGFIDV